MSIRRTNPISVADVALGLDRFPVLAPSDFLKAALEEMTAKRLGIACIVDADRRLLGVFTDGDIRRHLLSMQRPFSAFFSDDVIDHAQRQPITVQADTPLRDALDLMGRLRIWDLPVVSEGRLIGLLHLHPLIEAVWGAEDR